MKTVRPVQIVIGAALVASGLGALGIAVVAFAVASHYGVAGGGGLAQLALLALIGVCLTAYGVRCVVKGGAPNA